MSDQPPTRPKPGSLRDRIKAFENQAASQAAPPPPRPKPGGLQQWKPRQPPPATLSSNDATADLANPAASTSTTSVSATPSTPPKSSHGTTSATGSGSGNSMSASDARESIKQGGSLKERMAALQGKVAFGGAGAGGGAESVAPKPKWKPTPPPQPVTLEDEQEEKQVKEEEEGKEEKNKTITAEDGSEDPLSSSSPPPPPPSSSPPPAEEVDPEDEERQRRAAIAARMAKLGGARVGMMGAPLGMFAANKPPPPPPVSRQQKHEPVESPPAAKEEEEKRDVSPGTGTLSETISTNSPPSHSKNPPLSMPAPAVPRRTGPPRRKPPKSPLPSEPSTPIPDPAGGAEVGAAETQEVLKGMEPLTKEERREVEVPPVEEMETMENLVVDATKDEHEPQEEEESKETFHAHAEVEHESEQNQIVEEPAEVAESLQLENEQEEESKNEELEAKDEDEEEEEARRKRISDRLAKMGGINPLFAAPPIPRRSSLRGEVVIPSSPPPQLPPFRRLSADSIGSVSIGGPARRSSVDSVKEVEHGVVKDVERAIPEQDERVEEAGGVREEHGGEEHVLDDAEESNDIMAASMLMETSSRHDVEEGEEAEYDSAPAPPPRPVRGSSGFVTRPPLSDDEQHEHEDEEAGEESPPPLPVSPRFASLMPRATASFSQFSHEDSEEHDVHEDNAKPVPVPHRSLSLRSSVLSTASKYSQDEEETRRVEEEHAEHTEEGGEEEREEEKEEDKEVKHVPPPPTRRVPLPPPPPPANEVEEQHTHTEPEQGYEMQSDEPLVIPPPTVERRHSKDDSDTDLPLPHPISVRQAQALTVRVERPSLSEAKEIMDDDEGDPIDPSIHTPKRISALLPPVPSATHTAESQEETREPDSNSSDLEAAKRKTIAERMAKLGGIRFGAAPVPGLPGRPPPSVLASEGGEDVKETEETNKEENEEVDEEEEERARKERIAAKLAGMGGMRIGMMPTMGIPPRPAQRPQAPAVQVPILPPSRAPPARPPPPIYQTSTSSHDGEWEHDSATTPSEDGVKVEMEESEMEEVHHEDAKTDEEPEHEDGEIVSPPVLPPLPRPFAPQRQPSLPSSSTPQPLQSVRPPVPSTANLVKRASLSGSTTSSSISIGRKSSSGSTGTTTLSYRPTATKGQSDYVMVEEPQADSPIEEQVSSAPPPPAPTRPPPPPQRAATASHSASSAPAISDSVISQWELPSIPSGSLGFGLPMGTGTGPDLELSWTDAMDEGMSRSIPPAPGTGSPFHRYPPTHAPPGPPPPAPPSHAGAPAPHTLAPSYGPVSAPPPGDLSADELMAVWGRVGVQVCETATTMYEKAKKALVGDGTYAGFVRGVLSEVPNAVKPAVNENDRTTWGYVVYAQNGSVVQRRISDIMPGDVVEMVDARFKGHKGLQSYTLQVGAVSKEIFVGVVAEYEPKKSKLKVLQANQHVGQQTVESASYKLEDLKSGALKVYRVLEA